MSETIKRDRKLGTWKSGKFWRQNFSIFDSCESIIPKMFGIFNSFRCILNKFLTLALAQPNLENHLQMSHVNVQHN